MKGCWKQLPNFSGKRVPWKVLSTEKQGTRGLLQRAEVSKVSAALWDEYGLYFWDWRGVQSAGHQLYYFKVRIQLPVYIWGTIYNWLVWKYCWFKEGGSHTQYSQWQFKWQIISPYNCKGHLLCTWTGHCPSFCHSTLPSFFLNLLQATICLLLGRTATSAPLMGKAMAGWFFKLSWCFWCKGSHENHSCLWKRSFGTAGKGRLKEVKCISDICDPSRRLSLPLFPWQFFFHLLRVIE